MDNSSLDLFKFFTDNFRVSDIYTLGWFAAMEWTALVSGILITLAMSFRFLEEKTAGLSGGKTNFAGAFRSTVLIAIGISIYFAFAWGLIDFFNAIYSALSASDSVRLLGARLDQLMSIVQSGDYSFSFSELIDAPLFLFAAGIYAITYGVLVFVLVGMNLAHAILVTFALFWGSVALPMSITNGFKMLAPLRIIAITVFIWPIIHAFFIFLVAGSFDLALDRAEMSQSGSETYNLGTLVFYMSIFSIINLFIIAATIAVPLVSQGIANGTGNITGMVASFAGAGVAAGMIAGKMLTKKSLDATKGGLTSARDGVNNLGAGLNKLSGTGQGPRPSMSFNPTSSDRPSFSVGSERFNPGSPLDNTPKKSAFSQATNNAFSSNSTSSVQSESSNSASHSNSSSSTSPTDHRSSSDAGSSSNSVRSSLTQSSSIKGSQSSTNATTSSSSTRSSGDSSSGLDAAEDVKAASSNEVKAVDTKPSISTAGEGGTQKNGVMSKYTGGKTTSDITTQQQMSESDHLDAPSEDSQEERNKSESRKKLDAQAKRGAIVNKIKKGG